MERIPVSSSNVEAIGYSASRQILEASFKGGRVYHWTGVDPATYAALMAAPSKGSFFNNYINYAFPYSQGEAPQSIIENALEEAPELAEAAEVAEIAATIAAPEARAASWLMRLGSALRRMMPF
jgi:hypothetical protein